jgi:hypothetical protein
VRYTHETDLEGAEYAGRAPAGPVETGYAAQAAAAGRTDVLTPAGLAGLQRAVGNAGVVDAVGSGAGRPLDAGTRTDMETRLGHDFGDVRVHTGTAAHESAQSVRAQAYTVGSDIVFADGRYDPGSDAGKHLLAHELTHVVQQRSGPVDGTDNGHGVRVSDPGDRFEREAAAVADEAMALPVQRQVEGDETEEEDGEDLVS